MLTAWPARGLGAAACCATVGLATVLCAAPALGNGTVWTVGGQEYRGQISVTGDGLCVARAEGQPVAIPFAALRRAVFGVGADLAGFGPLEGGWAARDVEGVNATGWAGQSGRAFLLQVLGRASQTNSEAFCFVYQAANGQAELTARLLELAGPEGQARASLTVRESLTPGGPFGLVGINAGGGLCFQARADSGKKARTMALGSAPLPRWLRLFKGGNQCRAYASADGRAWGLVAATNLSLGQRFYVGLALSARGAFRLAQARFDPVQVLVSGLRGEYFADPDFGRVACVRVDSHLQFAWNHRPPAESVPADRFSVRWTGQIEPERTDLYAFHVEADGPARLWIDGQLVAARQPEKAAPAPAAARPAAVRLEAGRRYPLRLEYQKLGGPGRLALAWSRSGRGQQVVPADRLYCEPEGLTAHLASGAGAAESGLPIGSRGVWLCSGSFLAGPVEAMDERTIKLVFGGAQALFIPTARAARVCLAAIRQPTLLESDRRGVLLTNGDFLEGEVVQVQGRQLKLSSVLFGIRNLSLDQVAAVQLRPVAGSWAVFEVRTVEGSRLQATGLAGDSAGLQVQEPVLGLVRVPIDAVAEIRRVGP